jgi:hypothetical protein
VAYEIYELQNTHQNVGLGMVGEFETMEEHDFLALVKKNASRWNTTFSAYRKTDKKKWQFWWFGSYAIKNAIMAGADAFNFDLKYHQFYEAENQLL